MTTTLARYTTQARELVLVQGRPAPAPDDLYVSASCTGCTDTVGWATPSALTTRQAKAAADHWARKHAADCQRRQR